jgi:hypothetical protein
MNPHILVVAKGKSVVNKFEQGSLLQAFNTKDFLQETGDYEEVSIFQLGSAGATEWVKLQEVEC